MKFLRNSLFFIIALSISLTSIQTFANSNIKVVDAESLNMRSGPGLTFEIIKKLKKGEEVEVINSAGDWLEIKYENETGWIASWLTTEQKSEQKNISIVSQVNSLNVRANPSIGSAVLERMNTGDEAIMSSHQGDWARIEFNGTNGWVYKEYIEEIVQQDERELPSQTDSSKTKGDTYTVAVDTLNVRKKANQSSKKISQIHKGEAYTIKETNGNWIKIALNNKKDGWVYSFHGYVSSSNERNTESSNVDKKVTIISNGTNIRQQPTTTSSSVMRVNAGQQFDVSSENGDWYEISLPNGESAYVAKWVVSTNDTPEISVAKQPRVFGTLQGITIVIDPGHGGNDRGTTGARGTDEKDITLPTAELLARKLKAAGANVYLTRESDMYVSLRKRVAFSHQHQPDAFVSVHYDATINSSVSGFTTYYAKNSQEGLAKAVNNGLSTTLSIRDRGAQRGDFFVLRENRHNAILLELGFLSNPNEENILKTDNFREQATHGIYNGLLNYFNSSID